MVSEAVVLIFVPVEIPHDQHVQFFRVNRGIPSSSLAFSSGHLRPRTTNSAITTTTTTSPTTTAAIAPILTVQTGLGVVQRSGIRPGIGRDAPQGLAQSAADGAPRRVQAMCDESLVLEGRRRIIFGVDAIWWWRWCWWWGKVNGGVAAVVTG